MKRLGRPAWAKHLAIPLLTAVCFGLSLTAALLQRVPDRHEEPLSTLPPETWNWQMVAVPVPVHSAAGADGSHGVHSIALTSDALPQIFGHSELHLLVATYETDPDLDYATVAFDGTGCSYRTAPGARFPNNDFLILHRGAGCLPTQGTATGRLALTITLRNTARLALWTYHSGAPSSSTPIEALIDVPGSPPGQWVARGRVVTTYQGSAKRRVELLAYVWQVRPGGAWIWWSVGLAVTGMLVGSVAFWNVSGLAPSREPFQRAAGAFCMAAALSGLYAIVTPPFQAADEPNHFVGFADVVKRPALAAQAAEWARLTQFERIQFDPMEKFRPSDIGRPGPAWNDGAPPDQALRGGGVHLVWKPVAALTRTWPAPRVLLAMRGFNALIFALAVAGFVWGAMRLVPLPAAHLLAWPLFFIPTLPFFGMHFSNHAPLLAAYTAMGLGVLLVVLDTERPTASGLLIGVGFGAAVTLSRSALPLAGLIAVLLVGRLALGGRTRRPLQSMGFWFGLAVPLAITGMFVDSAYLNAQAGLARGPLLTFIAGRALFVARHPWLLIVAGAAAAAIEVGVGIVRTRISGRLGALPRRGVAGGAVCAAAALGALMISSLWVHYPVLQVLNPAALPSPWDYVRRALQAALTSPRLRFHDHLTSVSFWGGFGWIDTLPPPWLIGLLTGASGIALVVLLLRIARTGAVRRGLWLLFAVIGALLSMAAYAFTVIALTPADLHGRYLLGLYLSVLLICWSSLADLDLETPGRWRRMGVAPGALSIAAIHAYCLCLILRRYF